MANKDKDKEMEMGDAPVYKRRWRGFGRGFLHKSSNGLWIICREEASLKSCEDHGGHEFTQ